MSAVVAEARWLFASGALGPPNNSMQLTALRTAADAGRYADTTQSPLDILNTTCAH